MMDVIREDMRAAGGREAGAKDRAKRRQAIHCGDPKQLKEETACV